MNVKSNSLLHIKIDNIKLEANLNNPLGAQGIVIFAHGSGSSRLSPRNQHVANILNQAGIATLLLDLLTKEEELIDQETAELRFNIKFLAHRLQNVTDWIHQYPLTKNLKIGYFGASTGAAAAIVAAAERPTLIKAIVSRGGRPDLADVALEKITAPTLLIVGGNDHVVIDLNKRAFDKLSNIRKMEIVPHATHLFEEPGTLDIVAELATQWFTSYLTHQ